MEAYDDNQDGKIDIREVSGIGQEKKGIGPRGSEWEEKLLFRVIQPKMGHVRSVTYHALEWSIIHRGLS